MFQSVLEEDDYTGDLSKTSNVGNLSADSVTKATWRKSLNNL